MQLKPFLRWGFVAVAATWASLQGYLSYIEWSGNFATVIEGELYRSGQLSASQLASLQAEHGFKSVLNLRGAEPGEVWYDEEVATAKALGLTHVDYRLSGYQVLTVEESSRLIALMRGMPKPLLVHCQRGADRTGLAISLYAAAISGEDPATAAQHLSIRFGHFSVPYLSATYPMDESWHLMLPFLERDSG